MNIEDVVIISVGFSTSVIGLGLARWLWRRGALAELAGQADEAEFDAQPQFVAPQAASAPPLPAPPLPASTSAKRPDAEEGLELVDELDAAELEVPEDLLANEGEFDRVKTNFFRKRPRQDHTQLLGEKFDFGDGPMGEDVPIASTFSAVTEPTAAAQQAPQHTVIVPPPPPIGKRAAPPPIPVPPSRQS